ncbi:NADH:ubiquinone reductase (Na(+)-transporting) subunit B [Candidatus Riflebacteria bacterium]
MKFVENILESIGKHFKEGKPLAPLHPFFEANETFFLSPKETTKVCPHVRDDVDLKRLMSVVIVALVPCLIYGIYNSGYQSFYATGNLLGKSFFDICLRGLIQVLPLIIVSYAVGLFWEFLFCIVRKHEMNEGFLVTGLLFPLIVPPTLPLWQAAVGISFGVVLGKEVFGGTGMNIFNPALTARCFIFFSYPAQMSGEVWAAINSTSEKMVDGFTGATALGLAAGVERGTSAVKALGDAGYSFGMLFFGLVPGSIGETSTFMCLIGAFILIITGVASWRIMLGCILGATGMAAIFNIAFVTLLGSVPLKGIWSLPPHWHMVMGGFAFGAVFMATDPVSSAATTTGKWIYGICIGAMAILIRVINPAYPEGMMLAILFMNIWAPLIDYYVVEGKLNKRRARIAK